MRLRGIGYKDYTCISNVLPEDVFFTREPPDFTSELSMDSLVIPSKAPDGIGLPGSHFGSTAFTASTNACVYALSYCLNVFPAASLSFLSIFRYRFKYTSERLVVSPLPTPFSYRNSFLVSSNISSLLLSGISMILFFSARFFSVTTRPANPVTGLM